MYSYVYSIDSGHNKKPFNNSFCVSFCHHQIFTNCDPAFAFLKIKSNYMTTTICIPLTPAMLKNSFKSSLCVEILHVSYEDVPDHSVFFVSQLVVFDLISLSYCADDLSIVLLHIGLRGYMDF